MNDPVQPSEKTAELINSALTNIQQLGGRQRGPNAAQLVLDVTKAQAQLATAAGLLAIADAIETSSRRIEVAILKATGQPVPRDSA